MEFAEVLRQVIEPAYEQRFHSFGEGRRQLFGLAEETTDAVLNLHETALDQGAY